MRLIRRFIADFRLSDREWTRQLIRELTDDPAFRAELRAVVAEHATGAREQAAETLRYIRRRQIAGGYISQL